MDEPLAKPNRRAFPSMRIPVFVSSPTNLSPEQDDVRNEIFDTLEKERLVPRALGQSDYTDTSPLEQICTIASNCFGGLILGFEQMRVTAGTRKYRARDNEYRDASKPIDGLLRLPTAWNHMEAGILFALGKPLLIMCEDGIDDGVFYPGTAGIYTQPLPSSLVVFDKRRQQLEEVIRTWRGRVAAAYMNVWPFTNRHK
jgi:hypothetical protein